MNFSEMGQSVARLLRQAPGTNGLYTSADLSAVINDANLNVAMDTGALQGEGEVYSVGGTYQYALSALCPDVLSIYKVFWNAQPLTRSNLGNFRWSIGSPKSSGTPRIYRIWNGMLELDSTPENSYPINVYYTRKPAALSLSAGSSEMPTEYHMAIVYRACAYLTIKDEKEMRYNAFFQKYQYELSRLKALMRGNDAEIIDLDPANAASLNNWYNVY